MAQPSTGNMIAGLASFFIPGLGQLIQGRILAALICFLVSSVLWLFLLGWLGHIVACVEASCWKGRDGGVAGQ